MMMIRMSNLNEDEGALVLTVATVELCCSGEKQESLHLQRLMSARLRLENAKCTHSPYVDLVENVDNFSSWGQQRVLWERSCYGWRAWARQLLTLSTGLV